MGLRRVVKHAVAGGGGDERTQQNHKGVKCRRKDKEGICRKNAAANTRRRCWGRRKKRHRVRVGTRTWGLGVLRKEPRCELQIWGQQELRGKHWDEQTLSKLHSYLECPFPYFCATPPPPSGPPWTPPLSLNSASYWLFLSCAVVDWSVLRRAGAEADMGRSVWLSGLGATRPSQ